MKKVYTNQNITMIGVVKAALEGQGIECRLKNENLSGALGELPFTETWPELWILDELKEKEALLIVHKIIDDSTEPEESWTCTTCGEIIEGQFGECWNCGHIKGTEKPLDK